MRWTQAQTKLTQFGSQVRDVLPQRRSFEVSGIEASYFGEHTCAKKPDFAKFLHPSTLLRYLANGRRHCVSNRNDYGPPSPLLRVSERVSHFATLPPFCRSFTCYSPATSHPQYPLTQRNDRPSRGSLVNGALRVYLPRSSFCELVRRLVARPTFIRYLDMYRDFFFFLFASECWQNC